MAVKGIGELLVQENKISVDQLAKAREEQRKTGEKLITSMVTLGFMSEDEMLKYLSEKYSVSAIDLDNFEIDKAVLKLIPKEVCLKHMVIPVTQSLGTIVVACADPSNVGVKDDLTFLTQSRIEFVLASERQINSTITRFHDSQKLGRVISDLENTEEALVRDDGLGSGIELIDQEAVGADAPIIRFVNLMMAEAVKIKASDIHIEPYENSFRVRFRIDGTLYEKLQPPPGTAVAIASRIKIMSGLDISEKRKPQDGRLKLKSRTGEDIDFRVSVMPSLYGEKLVLRLLDKSGLNKSMASLGFEPYDLEMFQKMIRLPQGMVLITGPTGSGKSTTVYSALNELNEPGVNIVTAEDPVEMNVEGINHAQVNPAIDLTFSSLLRSFLRQDPNVIFVGEIRDLETAEVAFKAASTGHMVLSTLHTNDAPSTVVRLTEIGIPGYLVTSTLSLVVAQRLVGRICSKCKVRTSVPPHVFEALGVSKEESMEFKLMKGEGCAACNDTGISGRVAIHEVMPMTPRVKDAIIKGATSTELRKIAVSEGLITLRQNALIKVKAGLTTIEEVLSNTTGD